MQEVLDHYAISQEDWLGGGGEANVYALGESRVIRAYKPGTSELVVRRRCQLLDDLKESAARISIRIPAVQDIHEVAGRFVTVESRLAGRPMDQVLSSEISDRRQLLRSYFTAAKQLGELELSRPWYGDLVREEPIHTQTFLEYALARVHTNLRVGGEGFRHIKEVELADALSEAPKSLVHLDLCPANVLVEDNLVTAVLDFGCATIVGDRRLDPIAAVVYLDPEITPSATDDDRQFGMTWLEGNELLPMYDPVRRWLAVFWLAAGEDESLHRWCLRVLSAS